MPRRSLPLTRISDLIGFLREAGARFGEDHVPLAAGAISFFTLISTIPLLLFAVMVAAFFFPADPGAVHAFAKPLYPTLGRYIAKALEEQIVFVIANKKILTLMIIFVGLYTGSQLFQMLESAINLIWRSRVRRSFWHSRIMALAMVISVGVLLFAASLLVNAVHILRFYRIPLLDCHLCHLPWLNNAILGGIIPLMLLTAIFALIYSALPTMRVTLRTVMPGAISAAVVWLASLHLFSWYVTQHFEAYSFLYGSLARLVLSMVWFYYSAFIMLLGAEVSATFHARLAAAGDTDEQNVETSLAADMEPVFGSMPAIADSDMPAR